MDVEIGVNYIESEDGEVDYIVASSGGDSMRVHLLLLTVNKAMVECDPLIKDELLVLATNHLKRVYESRGVEVKFATPGGTTH